LNSINFYHQTSEKKNGEKYMSFQKYIANITKKTGKTPEKIREDARSQGVIVEDMTATVF